MGQADASGSGNALANTLTGNAANNVLDGGFGNDTLIGGQGGDIYVSGHDYGSDAVREDDAAPGSAEVVRFLDSVGAEQIWLRHVEDDLEVSVVGTEDVLTIENWYLGGQHRVEQFMTADGRLLLDSRVETLVQAMAAFAPPMAGQISLPPSYSDALAPAIAANWQ